MVIISVALNEKIKGEKKSLHYWRGEGFRYKGQYRYLSKKFNKVDDGNPKLREMV